MFWIFSFYTYKGNADKGANITTEIVDVGRAPVKSRNGFVGNSSNNLSGIVVFSIEVNLSSTSFRRADSASPCCKPAADTSNPALAAIPTAAAIPVVRIKIPIIRPLILPRFSLTVIL